MAAKKSNAPTAEELAQMRHSAAHVLAEAVLEMFPEAKYAIGPPIDTGFYYDFDLPRTLTPDDLKILQKRMKKSVKKNLAITGEQISKKDAKKIFANQPYKLELIEDIEEETVGHFTHGNFEDLCRGGHAASTGQIGAFELTHVAGAYWKGDENNPMLQRVYGALFATDDELQAYLKAREEAAERDHRRLGRELDLFFLDPLSPGSPFFLPGGTFVVNELTNYLRELYIKYGYDEVITPQLFSSELWKTSGHYENFQGDMFLVPIDDQEMGIKPMNCPGHCVLYSNTRHSYRELPMRIAEFTRLHRNERSGVLHGLTRARSFSQDDAHIFCTAEQLQDEISKLFDMTKEIYAALGLENLTMYVATRGEKFIGDPKDWDIAEQLLMDAVSDAGFEYQVSEAEAAFYGPKIEMHLKDALNRSWQLGTIQLDQAMPKRFNLRYINSEGNEQEPTMIHRALLGSLERFIGIYLEYTAGKLPFWLSPTQISIIPITDKHVDYCYEVQSDYKSSLMHAVVDDSSERMGAKIRNAQMNKIPFMFVVGDQEMDSGTVAVRTRNGEDFGQIDRTEILNKLKSLKETRLIDLNEIGKN
tara:strand:- start:573 stop:2336 length:1764 start_codon:yes stop_codon:yes gene_type:complete